LLILRYYIKWFRSFFFSIMATKSLIDIQKQLFGGVKYSVPEMSKVMTGLRKRKEKEKEDENDPSYG